MVGVTTVAVIIIRMKTVNRREGKVKWDQQLPKLDEPHREAPFSNTSSGYRSGTKDNELVKSRGPMDNRIKDVAVFTLQICSTGKNMLISKCNHHPPSCDMIMFGQITRLTSMISGALRSIQ